jgi:hypothetical protein
MNPDDHAYAMNSVTTYKSMLDLLENPDLEPAMVELRKPVCRSESHKMLARRGNVRRSHLLP